MLVNTSCSNSKLSRSIRLGVDFIFWTRNNNKKNPNQIPPECRGRQVWNLANIAFLKESLNLNILEVESDACVFHYQRKLWTSIGHRHHFKFCDVWSWHTLYFSNWLTATLFYFALFDFALLGLILLNHGWPGLSVFDSVSEFLICLITLVQFYWTLF